VIKIQSIFAIKIISLVQYKTTWKKEDALKEMQRWCASQERCHEDVRKKLIEHRVFGDDLEEIMATLISEDFLNESRYALAYVSGKFKINEWGRNKILAGLKQKKISAYNIANAMKEINENDYQKTLIKHFNKKLKEINLKTKDGKMKIMNYLLQKGFESEMIIHMIQESNS
jgi:regulatory protein